MLFLLQWLTYDMNCFLNRTANEERGREISSTGLRAFDHSRWSVVNDTRELSQTEDSGTTTAAAIITRPFVRPSTLGSWSSSSSSSTTIHNDLHKRFPFLLFLIFFVLFFKKKMSSSKMANWKRTCSRSTWALERRPPVSGRRFSVNPERWEISILAIFPKALKNNWVSFGLHCCKSRDRVTNW